MATEDQQRTSTPPSQRHGNPILLITTPVHVVTAASWLYPFKVLSEAHDQIYNMASHACNPLYVGHLLFPRSSVSLPSSSSPSHPRLRPFPHRAGNALHLDLPPPSRLPRPLPRPGPGLGSGRVSRPGRRRRHRCLAIRSLLHR